MHFSLQPSRFPQGFRAKYSMFLIFALRVECIAYFATIVKILSSNARKHEYFTTEIPSCILNSKWLVLINNQLDALFHTL
jgi:hypothetical protein